MAKVIVQLLATVELEESTLLGTQADVVVLKSAVREALQNQFAGIDYTLMDVESITKDWMIVAAVNAESYRPSPL